MSSRNVIFRGFVRGLEGELPELIQFKRNVENGAILAVVSSSMGVVTCTCVLVGVVACTCFLVGVVKYKYVSLWVWSHVQVYLWVWSHVHVFLWLWSSISVGVVKYTCGCLCMCSCRRGQVVE